MIQYEREIRQELIEIAARQLMIAARTAPKGKGVDIIEIAMVTGADILRLHEKMLQIADETGMAFFIRDAENIMQSGAVIIIGTAQQVQGLNCAHCGFISCKEKPSTVPCALNTIDVGIALGSACSQAADLRVDTRIMFSAGLAAQQLQMLGDSSCVIAIPLSISSKNPFFDRKPKEMK